MAEYKFKNPETDEFIKTIFDNLPHKEGREYKTLELLDEGHSLSPDQIKMIMGMFFFELGNGLSLDELMHRVSHVLLAGNVLDFDSISEEKTYQKYTEVRGIFTLLSDWKGDLQ